MEFPVADVGVENRSCPCGGVFGGGETRDGNHADHAAHGGIGGRSGRSPWCV